MRCHQVLTGACNTGDGTFAVGRVEGVPFTAYAAGCNIVILAQNFERVQVIPGVCHNNVQISCIDCSTDTGKIAAAYGRLVNIFEPSPVPPTKSSHHLDYAWVQTGVVEASCLINNISWNLEGTRLITAGDALQLWAPKNQQTREEELPVAFELGAFQASDEATTEPDDSDVGSWVCQWQTTTAQPTQLLSFSPDSVLFATCAANDCLIKLWYDRSQQLPGEDSSSMTTSYGFVYLPHPAAVTGFTWRSTSKYMPRGSVSNMLVSSCRDNICRVWVETVLPDDGLLPMHQLNPVASQNPRFRTHRHKHRFISRLKHIKACFGIRRANRLNADFIAAHAGGQVSDPLPIMQPSHSTHDLPSYGFHAMGVTAGFHFHLAASINAATDIPLVPSLGPVGPSGVHDDADHNFVLHWLNNKEMHFTQEAENILLEVSKRALEKEVANHIDADRHSDCSDARSRPASHAAMRGTRSFDEDDSPLGGNVGRAPTQPHVPPNSHHNILSAATSTTSIATDVTTTAAAALGDALDRRIEGLLRHWLHSSDMVFSVHPVDGSLLVWILDFLDDYQGSFRQAQVSFCARIPNALPLGDAMTMSPNLALYTATNVSFVQQLVRLELAHDEECRNVKVGVKTSGKSASPVSEVEDGAPDHHSPPVVCMTTKHVNGSLNLWHITVEADSKYTQVLNILHQRRVCGHRFQLNAVKCHPELPLLLTTSHHNRQPSPPTSGTYHGAPPDHTPLICVQDTGYKDWCSELLVWRVDSVGPLGRSGGVTEIARLNSPMLKAFSNAAWIPTLLPSHSLGTSSNNSPSACFVASDGARLRVYQAVLDGRALLAELSVAERRRGRDIGAEGGSATSLSTEDSSLRGEAGRQDLGAVLNIVSEQSTARPGCVVQLAALDDATHHSTTTQLLHVYHEGLVLGNDSPAASGAEPTDSGGSEDVARQLCPVVEEPFYVTLLEEVPTGSVVHMWRLVMASPQLHSPVLPTSPDALDEHDDVFTSPAPPLQRQPQALHQDQQREVSPLVSRTVKVCCQRLPLPRGVSVLHAAPSAGHLSSACIYPACRAPYLMVTACSDNKLRFWRCAVIGSKENLSVEWQEWNMVSTSGESAISLPGVPLYVSCAYSGRLACAYLPPTQASVVAPWPDSSASKFACRVAVYECESTGGSQWIMCDPVSVEDVVDTDAGQLGKQLLEQSHVQKVSVCRTTTNTLASVLSSESLAPDPSSPVPHKTSLQNACHSPLDQTKSDPFRSVSSMLHVPSLSTIHSIRSEKFCKRGVHLKQRHPIQLDWASKEDGTFLLTVAIGSKIVVLSDVSEEVAALTTQGREEWTGSLSRTRHPVLQKTLSMNQITLPRKQRYLELSRVQLSTADNLAPLPMNMGWVREGLLVVGMDNEMHCYTQWADLSNGEAHSSILLSILQQRPFVPSTSPACTLLYADDAGVAAQQEGTASPCTVGLMEASQAAAPVLPLYHPRQLSELLNSGKIRRVKAILAHLLRYLTQLSQQTCTVDTAVPVGAADARASWSRTRTLSVGAQHASLSGSREGRGSLSLRPEDLNLAMLDVKAVPPMPLWQLLEADRESLGLQQHENQEETYAELFGNVMSVVEDDLQLDEDETDRPARRASIAHELRGLAYFGPRQTQLLTALLTHTQLPGLSSLEQMHLLALSDTVASCNVVFADKFDINLDKEAIAKETYSRSATDEPSMDALDDCGLRFLLAVRHHTYLLRCLPLGQRSSLQRHGIGSHNIAWAFHSESQEELLQFIPSCRHGNPRWSELRELGAGWWVRNHTVLTKLMLMIAKSAFQQRKDPLDAAIYYLAMKKKSLVWGLFRSINDKRMTDFFASDFTEERWRKAALKNAFALMGKQRFEHAAAFFLLAGALKDAIEVVVTLLQDEQLAMVIIRLYEGELEASPAPLRKMLYLRVLGRDENGSSDSVSLLHPDPFLRSMAYWMMNEYSASLQTLLCTDPLLGTQHPAAQHEEKTVPDGHKQITAGTTADPSVFNFYIHLRTHPLLIRQCIANTARDTGGLMASRLAVGAESLDKKSAYESSMTPLERRLYFTTAHAHLQAGCPVLALEVLSKLPDNVLHANQDGDKSSVNTLTLERPSLEMINTGTLDDASLDAVDTAGAFNWGSSAANVGGGGGDELELDFTIDEDDEEEEKEEAKPVMPPVKPGQARHLKGSEGGDSVTGGSRKQLDVMAQQLKFIACLKIMMSELETLGAAQAGHVVQQGSGAAGGVLEESGGQLRHELHVWLERQVLALREVCGYKPTLRMTVNALVCGNIAALDDGLAAGSSPGPTEASTLQEILQKERLQFQDKLERAQRRKLWLGGNQKLLHTLLGYCSLHGCSGGGLWLVRLELVLLLQELQQDEAARDALLSPLPCPTMLPLLSAAVAANKTVVADPVKQLQSLCHDLLSTLVEVRGVGAGGLATLRGRVLVLRDLAVALSSCVHQALCDSHALPRGHRGEDAGDDHLQVTTQPSKWPGVTSLLCLVTRCDEDTPRLSLLLCEVLVSVYLCLLAYALVNGDPAVLYRLVARPFTAKEWALVFGGGARRVVVPPPSVPHHVLQPHHRTEREPSSPGGSMGGFEPHLLSSTLSSLQKTRIKLNMKLLGQLGFQEARTQSQDGEAKPTYREQFVNPHTSIIAFLMSKPRLPSDCDNVDYDSSASDDEELLDEYEEEEDIFKEPKVQAENKEHSDPASYSWCLLRLASVQRAQATVKAFLEVPQLDIHELAVQSPLLHRVLLMLQVWSSEMTAQLEALQGPPPEYIPGCFAQSAAPGEPPISKYRALMEPHNTPFARGQRGVAGVERLWRYLVRQESVQEVFVRYIFARKRRSPEPLVTAFDASDDALSDSMDVGGGGTEEGSEAGQLDQDAGSHSDRGSVSALEPVRIIHKEQDSIAAFCINRVNSGLMSVATVKEVQELDISLLLQRPAFLHNTTELDLLSCGRDGEGGYSNYLVVQCPADKELLEGKGQSDLSSALASSSSSLNYSNTAGGQPAQTGRGTSVIRSHKTEGARRMIAHPVLPIYLVGCQDGSVTVREWQHTGVVARPRPGGTFAKVARLRFNQQGNKFGVMDADGNLALYHLGLGTQVNSAFYMHQCHNKYGSDFAFVGSSSLLATCGQSSDHRNVAMWDTLLPPRKACVVSWLCHDNGASAMLYAPQHQVLLTAGKKGTVCIYDIRQRTLRHRFQAHESAVKCMTLDHSEEFFVTGAADGDIKVWGLTVHNLIYNLPGEHSRTSLFKNLSQGVSHLHLDSSNRLFSCGADGSIKMRTFPERDLNLNLL